MRKISYLPVVCGALALAAAAPASAQQMTARELFYAAAPAENKPQAAPKKAPTRKPQERVQVAQAKPPAAPPGGASNEPASANNETSSAPSVPIASGLVINASMRTSAPPPTTGTPLGLKYTLLKLEGSSMTPVAPDTVFHKDDKIQFNIEANGPGYLYIVARGSSGKWQPLFPSPEIANGDNHIEGFHDYTLPSGYRFAFDELPGAERVFLILSRDPKPDFEQLVYSLQDKAPAKPVNTERPAVQPQRKMLTATNIDDPTIDRMRTVYARDLVIEKADTPASDPKDKAEFVVNASGASDSVVVADLSLAHQ